MFNNSGDDILLRDLERLVQPLLNGSGVLHRLFGRVKEPSSIENKNKIKGYSNSGQTRKMQDLFGLRVAVYFADDEQIVSDIFTSKFEQIADGAQVDVPKETHFGVRRNNLILKLPQDIAKASRSLEKYSFIDPTFELQLRTVFSEGWHEVDHDLRYKCKDDWNGHSDLGRGLNGLAATLETCDWAAVQMFDELAWRHYRNRKWQACFRTKFRLRFQGIELAPQVIDLLNRDEVAAKDLFRVSRQAVIGSFWAVDQPIPVSLQNALFVANRLIDASQELKALEPTPIADWLDRHVPLNT